MAQGGCFEFVRDADVLVMTQPDRLSSNLSPGRLVRAT